MEHIGQKIKDLRKKADMTQDRLAEMLGVTAQAVSKWEVGSASPDLSLIPPLCRVFGVTADELLGIAEEKENTEKQLLAAHRHCMNNRAELGASDLCGCFFCRQLYRPQTIVKWVDRDGNTALCPFCGIDSVIGSASGYPMTPEFLSAMYDRWFKPKSIPGAEESGMTPGEFRDYLNRGLGRAILLLEKEKDKQIFCAVWQRMLLHPENESPDKSGIVPYYARSHGLYDRDLALCFDPSGRLGAEIADKILEKRPPRWHALQLASLLGREKEVNEILKEGFDASTSVLRQCLRGETDRGWDDVAQGWLEIAGVRAFCGTPKREIIHSVLCDIADLFRLAPEREEDLKTLFWRYEDELRGKNWDLFWDILLEENPLASVMTVTETARSPVPAQEITAERCLAARQEDEEFDALVDGFQYTSDEVFFAVLDSYLDEKTAGSARAKTLSLFFRDVSGRDTGGLLARVRRILDDPALRDTPVPLWLLEYLKHTRDPRVRELGMELMNVESGQLRFFGRHMVYGANFMPEDADTVEEWLINPPEVKYSASYDVLDALEADAEGVRESWFRTLYEDSLFRLQLVEILYEKGRLPDDMREESLYDVSPYVRAAARGELPEIRRHWRRKVIWKE